MKALLHTPVADSASLACAPSYFSLNPRRHRETAVRIVPPSCGRRNCPDAGVLRCEHQHKGTSRNSAVRGLFGLESGLRFVEAGRRYFMGQMGFYDLANRYAGLDAKNEPLVIPRWMPLRTGPGA